MGAQAMIVALNSQQPERLRTFYETTVGLAPKFDFAPGAFALTADAPPCLIVESHDQVADAAKEPQRVLINLLVADARGEEARLRSAGVSFVEATYEEPGVGLFATFADPDGNYCQLVQLRA